MIGYINTVRDREYKLCTPEQFDNLVNSPMVTTHIEDYRKGSEASKQLLPAFIFQGYDPNVLLGKRGSRLAKALQPTGFFIMDFDHVENPREVYDLFLQKMPQLGFELEKDLCLAHITPSGKGLRLVLVTPKGMTIEAAQEWVAKIMEIECDAVVKDLSRLSFCPMASDILYINKALLFNNASTNYTDFADEVSKPDSGRDENNSCNPRNPLTEKEFPATYKGIPYSSIVEELIRLHGGTPEIGNRENTLFRLASDLAKITDRSAPWLESLIPTFGLPESEWRNTIAQVCKKPMETGISRKLQEAIRRCRTTENYPGDVSVHEELPPAMPEKLPSLVSLLTEKVHEHQKAAVAVMSFPALGVHVNNCKFKLKENTDVELSLMSCLLAPQSAGKGCVKQPLKLIMQDIKSEDKVNRQREKEWQEERNNKKANEKGKSKPDDIVIRFLSSDTTPAAFLGRLQAAEKGDGINPNLCTYSQVDEIEDLYRFCSGGGKNYINQMIKRSWDRDDIGAERWSANSANISTVLRWNWAASSTIDGGKNFFRRCLTDGTTSRVDFCTIVTPEEVIDFHYGNYDADFRNQLKPYVENLKKFSCEKDEDGEVIPMVFPRIIQLEGKMNDYINETSGTMPDNTWVNYAWRAKIMAIKKLIILYIANGCEWEYEFEPFIWWSFHYSMWCKMNLFYDAAAAQFADERITGQRGNRSPLKAMRRTFTLAQFAHTCQQMQVKQRAIDIIYKYKSRGVIVQNPDDTFTIQPEYARKFAIK